VVFTTGSKGEVPGKAPVIGGGGEEIIIIFYRCPKRQKCFGMVNEFLAW
jgi:hypothetical protein